MFIKMDSTWTSKPSMLGIDLDALIAMYRVQHSNLLSTFYQLNTKINITVKVIFVFHPMPCRLRMVILKKIRFPLWPPWWYMHFGVFSLRTNRHRCQISYPLRPRTTSPWWFQFGVRAFVKRMYPIVYVYFPFHLPH